MADGTWAKGVDCGASVTVIGQCRLLKQGACVRSQPFAAELRRLEQPSYTLDELARYMVSLDRLMGEAVAAHLWYEAADLEALREEVMYVRMRFVRNRWYDAHPSVAEHETAPAVS